MVQVIVKPNNKKSQILNLLEESIERKKLSFNIAIKQTKEVLCHFEKQYKMKTGSFYKKWKLGILGDKADYVEWAGEKEILNRLKKELTQIQEISFVH